MKTLIIAHGGVLNAVGLPAFSEGSLSIRPFDIELRNLHIIGTFVGTVIEMRELIQLAAMGKVKTHVGRVTNHSEINQVLEELRKGKIEGRAIVNNIMK